MYIEMKLITFDWREHSFMIGKRRRHGSRKIQRWSQGGGKGFIMMTLQRKLEIENALRWRIISIDSFVM